MVLDRKDWTREECREEALKYSSIKALYRGYRRTHQKAQREWWMIYCCQHMKNKPRDERVGVPHKWTKTECLINAAFYIHSDHWKLNNPGAYESARVNGWLPECQFHMFNVKKHVTRRDCLNSLEHGYESIKQWKNDFHKHY